MNIQQICETYVANTYKRYPVTFVRGAGAHLWDEAGREYIDLGSGIAVNIFGVSDPIWAEAVTRQLTRPAPHLQPLLRRALRAIWRRCSVQRTGMQKVFFSNSGAEANECMLKAARKYGEATGRSTIVTLKDSFHGRTIATLAATGQDVFHQHFGPFPAGFAYATPNDLSSVRALCEEQNACAVMLEVVQGEGGVRALDGDFLRGVEALCREKDMLLLHRRGADRQRPQRRSSTPTWSTASNRTSSPRPRVWAAACPSARRCWAKRSRIRSPTATTAPPSAATPWPAPGR